MILKEWLDKKYTKEEQKIIKYLNCSNNNITSLEGIENLPKLEWLNCADNKLTSLKGIENLPKLEWLFCYDNPLPYFDLEDINKLKAEVKKEVRQTKIKNLL
jgi:Leucine-rich repeat (LRR) protein